MTDPFQIGAPSLASFYILIAMSAATLALSIMFYRKFQAVKKLPKDLRASIFSRTFNVFNPYPEKRRTFHSYLFFLVFSPLVAFSWTFILVFIVILNVLQAGYILGFILFIVCLNLMLTSEASEIYATTSKLLNAARAGTSLGRGDLAILHLTRRLLSKLSKYYFILAGLFAASFFAAPYLSLILLAALAYVVGAITTATASTLFLAPILAALFFTMIIMAILILARKIQGLMFNFAPSRTPTSTGSAYQRMWIPLYDKQYETTENNPDEMNS